MTGHVMVAEPRKWKSIKHCVAVVGVTEVVIASNPVKVVKLRKTYENQEVPEQDWDVEAGCFNLKIEEFLYYFETVTYLKCPSHTVLSQAKFSHKRSVHLQFTLNKTVNLVEQYLSFSVCQGG